MQLFECRAQKSLREDIHLRHLKCASFLWRVNHNYGLMMLCRICASNDPRTFYQEQRNVFALCLAIKLHNAHPKGNSKLL